MTVTVTNTEILSQGLHVGYMGYHVHNHERPHDERFGITQMFGETRLTKVKTSVVDGSFIPGKYRVNPYTVTGGRIQIPSDSQGSFVKGDFPLSNKYNYPGIDQSFLNLIEKDTPIYLAIVPFVNTYWTNYGGYVVGKTYYDVVFLFGNWWKHALPALADKQTTPRSSADFEQLSLQKAYGKIRDADLPLGEDVGELRQTIEMLRSPLSALKKFLVDDKCRNFSLLRALALKDKREISRLLGRTGYASADAVASTWLELRYGLRPLVMLVQDVFERIKAAQESFDPDKIQSVRSKLVFGPYQTWAEPTIVARGKGSVRSKCLVEDTYTSVASVQYRQTIDASFLDSLGLTPRFLPETAWNLSKLSFVWDWLFSIGPWLATLRVNPGVEILGNTSGFKHARKISVLSTQLGAFGTIPDIPWQTLKKVHATHGDLNVFVYSKYTRKVNLDMTYLPHFTWGRTLDLQKAVDAAALTWQFANFWKMK